MDPEIWIGAASLLATLIGTWAAVAQIRRERVHKKTQNGTLDPKFARRVLAGRTSKNIDASDALEIIARFIFVNHDGRTVVGALDQFEIELFLDLFSAATVPRWRDKLAQLIVQHFKEIQGEREMPDYIAVPKEGNVLLAEAVARKMGCSLVVVRTLVPAIRFGNPVEGIFESGACVLLVDDIATDGELLVRTAGHIRTHGGRLSLCVCAVERMDGNSRESLESHNVELSTPIRIDENTLRELARLPTVIDLSEQQVEKDTTNPAP